MASVSSFAALSPAGQQELWAVLALRHAQGIGSRRAKRLVEHFGSALAAAEAVMAEPLAWFACGITSDEASADFAAGSWRKAARSEWLALRKPGVSFIQWTDLSYPPQLREIFDAPLLVYYKGDISLLHGPAVAVVGARKCTEEGIAVAAWFSRCLSQAGVTVLSGMALGIDRAAHLAGLQGAGRSVAVLGTGIDVIYPACNDDVYDVLAHKGLILSEFPLGTQPSPGHFPIRNRIISGLSRGVLVVEAAGRSGSLITARLALEQNRDVFAVPGHTLAAMSEGCRELIRRGARPVFDADDILEDLAPLLALEARRALEQRLEASQTGKAAARQSLRKALEQLPDQGVPWQAPPKKRPSADKSSAKKKKSLSKKSATSQAATVQSGVPSSNPAKGVNFELPLPVAPPLPVLDADEQRVVSALSLTGRHIDDIASALSMDVAHLSATLTMLEVRGLVRRLPGMVYCLPGA